jgi:hypothetical protein
MTERNHYATLGLWRDASPDEIKSTYRSLVQLHHPDVNQGDLSSAARFLDVQAAYDVLGDPAARTAYDASLLPAEEEQPEEERHLPAVIGERDRPSVKSAAAFGLGIAAAGILIGATIAEYVTTLSWRDLTVLRVTALVLGIVAARLAKSVLQKLGRLRELHEYGVGTAMVDLPAPSVATRTAARCGWMLGRAAPIGFVLLTLAAAAQKFQELQPMLQTLRGLTPVP